MSKWTSKAKEYDKLVHMIYSFALAALLFKILTIWNPVWWAGLAGGVIALIAGLVWEVKDHFVSNGFDWKDLVADGVGVGIFWIIWAIVWVVRTL